jgi:RsmE family RNA methyltransferase
MNIILLAPEDWFDENTVCLDGRRHEHIRGILKAEIGDALRVGLLGGLRGSGRVVKLSDEHTHLQVDLVESPLPRHPCDLILALPRPKMLRRVFRTAAEMGVANLYLINSARVEKSYWQSPLLQPDRINAALTAGLERAGDTALPQVHLHPRFKPFIEDQLPELIGSSACWIAHPGAGEALATQSGEGLIMLGPEGGFVPYEVELAQSMGAQPVRLSDRILSVDTAVTAALSQSALSS